MNEENYKCRHCGEILVRWEPSPDAGWDHDLYLCNNNRCSYFVNGREKMSKEHKVNFAYRYCYDPFKHKEMPIVSWCGGDLSLLKGRCS